MSHLRLAIVLFVLLLPASSRAQSFLSCVNHTQSWSGGYQGQITSTTYIVSMPLVPAPPVVLIRLRSNQTTMGWLIGINGPADNTAYVPPPGFPRNVNILIGIPSNVASQYQTVTNADAKFAQQRRSGHELVLLDGTFCPLLAEDAAFSSTGYPIWSR